MNMKAKIRKELARQKEDAHATGGGPSSVIIDESDPLLHIVLPTVTPQPNYFDSDAQQRNELVIQEIIVHPEPESHQDENHDDEEDDRSWAIPVTRKRRRPNTNQRLSNKLIDKQMEALESKILLNRAKRLFYDEKLRQLTNPNQE